MVFLGGLFLALAIGVRLTVAPLALAFLGATLFAPAEAARRERYERGALLALGAFIGSLPLGWMVRTAPRAFLFDVVTWPDQ